MAANNRDQEPRFPGETEPANRLIATSPRSTLCTGNDYYVQLTTGLVATVSSNRRRFQSLFGGHTQPFATHTVPTAACSGCESEGAG